MSNYSHISNTVLSLSDNDRERLFNSTKAILKQYLKFETVFLHTPSMFSHHSFKKNIDTQIENTFQTVGIEGKRKHIAVYLKGLTVEIQFSTNDDLKTLHAISLRIEPMPKGRFIILLETMKDNHLILDKRCSWYFPAFIKNSEEASKEIERISS